MRRSSTRSRVATSPGRPARRTNTPFEVPPRRSTTSSSAGSGPAAAGGVALGGVGGGAPAGDAAEGGAAHQARTGGVVVEEEPAGDLAGGVQALHRPAHRVD